MPRVVSNPFWSRELPLGAATPYKSPVKIPLNDDKQEKANRLQSRQAQHEVHMSHVRSAATPLRKRRSLAPGDHDSPHTPQSKDDVGFRVTGDAVTPMKRIPIMANFEEWMKMATDNKINAQNSWNFALIDYFHDMSLLKEGDGVNFQRASCTLDGCVKIYTSRVDSVATETGKLLSGLAESRDKNKRPQEGDGEDAEVDEDEFEAGAEGSKPRRKKTKTCEATLVNSFAQLQLKKMELEFAVDPLFKKASADFDEGGAKGLLLNHLSIDSQGRIVFGSSDDILDSPAGKDSECAEASESDAVAETSACGDQIPGEVDVAALGLRFFPDLSALDEQDICTSLKHFDFSNADGPLNLPFIKPPEDWKQDLDRRRSGAVMIDPTALDYDEDDDGGVNFDGADDVGFGDGGEIWAREAAIETQHAHPILRAEEDGGIEEEIVDGLDTISPTYGVKLMHDRDHEQENILNYFDQVSQKNWAGPEHWKIRKFKENAKTTSNTPPSKRKEKEAFEIDFAGAMSQETADILYTAASSSSHISMPRVQWKSRSRNLLPDDKHFSSRQLLSLFLKPKARMGPRRTARNIAQTQFETLGPNSGNVEEGYWAQLDAQGNNFDADAQAQQGNYDADFFQDGGIGGLDGGDDDSDVFADAREMFSPPLELQDGAAAASIDAALEAGQAGAFGTQLVTESRRLRPEYVQYARVAKKVDVRRLKEEMWKGIGYEQQEPHELQTPSRPEDTPPIRHKGEELKFTEVMRNLQTVYPQQAMADISTSFCFICLLHLANEKGLTIDNHEDFQELTIRKDLEANLVPVEA